MRTQLCTMLLVLAAACSGDSSKDGLQKPSDGAPVAMEFSEFVENVNKTENPSDRVMKIRFKNFSEATLVGYEVDVSFLDQSGQVLTFDHPLRGKGVSKVPYGISGGRTRRTPRGESKEDTLDTYVPEEAASARVTLKSVIFETKDSPEGFSIWHPS